MIHQYYFNIIKKNAVNYFFLHLFIIVDESEEVKIPFVCYLPAIWARCYLLLSSQSNCLFEELGGISILNHKSQDEEQFSSK